MHMHLIPITHLVRANSFAEVWTIHSTIRRYLYVNITSAQNKSKTGYANINKSNIWTIQYGATTSYTYTAFWCDVKFKRRR